MATITKRKTSKGATRYRAQIRIHRGGRTVHAESRTFAQLATAKAWARDREHQLERPGAIEKILHEKIPIRQLIGRYREEMTQHREFGRTKNSSLRQLQGQEFTETNALTLTRRQILDHLQARRAAGAGASTVKNDLIWLRVVFRYAKRVWGVPLDIDMLNEVEETAEEAGIISRPRRRNRRPNARELTLLTEHFRIRRGRYPMDLILWLAIYSARRQDELCRLRRGDFNPTSGTYWVRDLKHPDGSKGNDRLAVLPEKGWRVYEAILERVPEPEDGRLLPFDGKTVSAYFTRACKMLAIPDLRFHDLRHEACSRLAEDGATVPEIQAVSLHDSWSSLQRYVQVTRQDRVDWEG